MPTYDAQKKAIRKWNEAHRGDYWRCTVTFPVAEKARVSAKAAAHGMTVSEYIRYLIDSDSIVIEEKAKKKQEDNHVIAER